VEILPATAVRVNAQVAGYVALFSRELVAFLPGILAGQWVHGNVACREGKAASRTFELATS